MSISLKLGVRELVEFCCRSGDLGFDGGPSASAQEGIQTHQKIQRRYRGKALAEQTLKLEIPVDEYQVELGGRVDLIFADESPPRLEEIKTVYSFLVKFSEDYNTAHWAQVKCYAACYALERDLDRVAVSLNYVNLFNFQENRTSTVFSRAELEDFLNQTLRQYLGWHRLVSGQRAELMASARLLEFPFAKYRTEQYRFSAQVYRNIKNGNRLLVEAPTGAGKTISTLFPSVKAIGEDIADQIVYLSAKTSGQNEALKAIDKMVDRGLAISYLVIQAKAKCCACASDIEEFNEEGKCRRTVGFFDRLSMAREALIQMRRLGSEQVRKIADQYQLCPFELSLQMLPWVDVIVCDFNYIFDPLVQMSYFKSDARRKVLLIDELHNLVDRARSMYSASINRRQLRTASFAQTSPTMRRAINSIANALDKCAREQAEDEVVGNEVPAVLTRATARFGEKLGLELYNKQRIAAETLEFAKSIFRFQCVANLYDAHHRTLIKKPPAEREVKLLCLNAFEYLQQCYPLFSSICGFSATLSPPGYYQSALGLTEQTQVLRLASSFPGENLKVSVGHYIDTRYRHRDRYIDTICTTIQRCYEARRGNYLVFFSSYAFMHRVHEHFCRLFPAIETMMQTRDADQQQRADYLSRFFEHENTLGFAIMGGVFAESIDYSGRALIGAIIVGVGLPQADTGQQLIQQDFERLQLNGFDFAYRFPGITRVQQSAGRVIRSETDRGIVVLLDNRFKQAGYQAHLPAHWQVQDCADLESLEQSLVEFWEHPDAEH
ncbi:MAG: ATP-dependent DNA helicase [Gammaproteobacteria bacterium]